MWRFSAEFLKRLGNFQSFTSKSVIVEVKKVLSECGVDKQKMLEKVEAVKIIVDEVVKVTRKDRVEALRLMKKGESKTFLTRGTLPCVKGLTPFLFREIGN